MTREVGEINFDKIKKLKSEIQYYGYLTCLLHMISNITDGVYWTKKYNEIRHIKFLEMSDEEIAEHLCELYKIVMGEVLNLDNPITFNEKIQWLKLYDCSSEKTFLADKYLVRSFVEEKIGKNYLIPVHGVYDKFEEINFL